MTTITSSILAPTSPTADGNGNGRQKSKSGHVLIRRRRLEYVKFAPENERLYKPIHDDDPEIVALADSIRKHGILEPLTITTDGYLISGHRRLAAAGVAGLATVPVRIKPISRLRHRDKFLTLLRECNRQRVKSRDELLREEAISMNPDGAYESLIEHRRRNTIEIIDAIEIRGRKRRAEISRAKFPFLSAVVEIIESRSDFWPLSDRQIHYALLNDPPLIHASKPDSRYTNDRANYQALCDLLTRARLAGNIPWEAIGDATRPMVVWKVFDGVSSFLRRELNDFGKGYWRDLLQSQPNHVEVVGEKNTIESIIRPVCAQFCVSYTIGRGYCCSDRRHALAERFERSGKDRLTLLMLSDFDPDGEEIAHSFVRSMRDDFEIHKIDAVKVALTAEQVEEYELPPIMKAKQKSKNYKRFADKHGDTVHELEALPPETLQQILRDAIDGVIDIEAFNYELAEERKDAAFLQGVRERVQNGFADLIG